MALLKYFQQHADTLLPKPDGPLSTVVPSSSITAANKAVKRALDLSDLSAPIESRSCTTVSCPCIIVGEANCHTHKRSFPTVRKSFIRENLTFQQFAKVFTSKRFPLYGISSACAHSLNNARIIPGLLLEKMCF